jgi:cell division protein FtsB
MLPFIITLAMRMGLIAAACLAVAAYLISWGDRHGFNAHRVAAIRAELAATNARLADYEAHDNANAATADSLRDEAYQRALADLTKGGRIPITPAMAEAFNRVR